MSPIVVNIHGAKLLSSKGAGSNARQHRHVAGKEKRRHREGANCAVVQAIHRKAGDVYSPTVDLDSKPPRFFTRPLFPAARVLFTRICPKRHFCDEGDNLAALFKSTRDGTADAFGVDDKLFVLAHPSMPVQSGKIGVWYEQIDGPWGVRITIWPGDSRAPERA